MNIDNFMLSFGDVIKIVGSLVYFLSGTVQIEKCSTKENILDRSDDEKGIFL